MVFQLNPLNVHSLRVLDHCPPHFCSVDFDLRCPFNNVYNWIYKNLQGRFYFGQVFKGNSFQYRAAFEIHSEASYFALVLDDINKFLPH